MSIAAAFRDLSASSGFGDKERRRAVRSLIGMALFIGLLHFAGWFTLIAIVVPHHFSVGTKAFGLGIGIVAYALGMRHAFDADHIAAIDNTTRKLIRDGEQPLSVGFWFSLGHSSVVFGLTLLLAFGVKALAGPLLDDGSALHAVTGLIGTGVSSGFLFAIAALNMVVLADIWRLFQRMRAGANEDAALEAQLESRGFLSRLLKPAMALVRKPPQMYFVGFLFGLGFDTATEIALLVLTSSGIASGLPWYAVLCLPILFASGMSLLDTIDGCFMAMAYGWAMTRPTRKIYYNLVVTGLSVAVAFIIGTIEIVPLISEKLKLHGQFWDWMAGIDLNDVGFVIVGLFVATWIIAVVVWKYGRVEERWATPAIEGD